MADASQAYRRSTMPSGGLRLEKYLGIGGVAAAVLGTLAIFGSVDSAWYCVKELFGSLYLLAVAVAS
ncbi:MAG TPA: hypothetical protein VMU87_09875 [Stellaceae bacterium]|nr:hypothetical protein [Stellaceae bacterium]